MDQPSARIPGQCDDDTRRTLDARGRRRRHLRRVLEAARSLTGARTHVGFAKAPGEAQKAQECRERLG